MTTSELQAFRSHLRAGVIGGSTEAVWRLEDLLASASMQGLAWLESHMRQRSFYTWDLSSLRPERLVELRGRTWAVGAASWHRNGYVRQRAVEILSTSSNGPELPFLLLRLADYVVPIRRLAEEAVLRRLTAAHALALARALPLVQSLEARKRSRSGHVVREVRALLLSCDLRVIAALEQVWAEDHWHARHLAHRFAFESALLHDDADRLRSTLVHAAGDLDVRTRLWTVRVVASPAVSAGTRSEVLGLLGADRSMAVRRCVVLARMKLDDGGGLFERAVFDRHAAIRYLARRLLRDAGDTTDFLADYRETIRASQDDVDRLVGALAGIEELGTAADAGLVLRYVDDPRPRVQGEAVRALGGLAMDEHRALIEAKANGDVRCVAMEARRALAGKTRR